MQFVFWSFIYIYIYIYIYIWSNIIVGTILTIIVRYPMDVGTVSVHVISEVK